MSLEGATSFGGPRDKALRPKSSCHSGTKMLGSVDEPKTRPLTLSLFSLSHILTLSLSHFVTTIFATASVRSLLPRERSVHGSVDSGEERVDRTVGHGPEFVPIEWAQSHHLPGCAREEGHGAMDHASGARRLLLG